MLLFPDSNLFMQCRSPAEIPWAEITADTEIRLFASRTVQGEVDRFKGDGKGRRSDRARKVSAWFAASIESGAPIVLRERSPRVTLELPPRIRPGHTYPPGLDVTRPDDRIVGEVLAFREAEAGATLLTDDTNMKLTARDMALPYIAIPASWRLDPEPDTKDRTIADLQKRLTALERSYPFLDVVQSLLPGSSEVSQRLRYAPLSATVIEELVEAIRSICPERTDFSRKSEPENPAMPGMRNLNLAYLSGMEWKEPSASAIADYGRRYAAWLGAVRVHLGRLHRSLPQTRPRLDVRWVLGNAGTVPAEGVIVDIEAMGGVALADSRSPPKEASPYLPEPPIPPAWEMSPTALHEMIGLQAAFRAAQPNLRLPLDVVGFRNHGRSEPVRDPYAFYRRGRPVRTLSRRWSFECSELRHGGDPKTFEATALTVGSSDGGVLRFRVSARNMPVPIEAVLPVRFVSSTGRTEDEARALVDMASRTETMRRKYRVPFGL
jgi:hypothetical protein